MIQIASLGILEALHNVLSRFVPSLAFVSSKFLNIFGGGFRVDDECTPKSVKHESQGEQLKVQGIFHKTLTPFLSSVTPTASPCYSRNVRTEKAYFWKTLILLVIFLNKFCNFNGIAVLAICQPILHVSIIKFMTNDKRTTNICP